MVEDKPCRACTDFKTWAKIQKETFDTERETVKKLQKNVDHEHTASTTRDNCPLDKDELGSKTWGFLHTMAAYYPDKPSQTEKADMKRFFYIFSKFYPCKPCADDLAEQLKVFPPQTESQEMLSQWLCHIHNKINRKLGKPEFNCKLVNQRWRDGWLDGSCD